MACSATSLPSLSLSLILLGNITSDLCAETRWPDEHSAGVFHCHANFELDRFEQLLGQMATLQQDLTRQLRVPPASESIHLFLFEQKGTYAEYLRLHFPDVPFRRALFIKEQGPGMVFAFLNNDFETDVRHESTHALLHASLPVVPLWLDEGLAEYFEVTASERAHSNPHLSKVTWAARFGQTPDLAELERIGSLSKMGATEYRHAWAWVHFMLHGPAEAHDELVSFLTAIRSLSPPGVLSDRLQQRIPDLELRFREHFRNWK
ncbi:MAG: DUF1570 domain-containing protein [Planctomycetes bacterium]|nr:DUF1570 domain-containing protein [Planctomycetota bacterium]